MFTGIIEDIAELKEKTPTALVISTVLSDIKIADSVSVNGVCLTVEDLKTSDNKTIFKTTLSLETLSRTNLKFLKPQDKINLERSLKVGSRVSGHFVTGHVDGIVELLEIKHEEYIFELPKNLYDFIVEKGSVALDGISLTVAKKLKDRFSVVIVPFTLNNTTLKYKKPKDKFNIEVDILARYIKEITKPKKEITLDFLKEHGFIK
ncbi:MAG: riboflavin synthase [Endomicrobiia bacterium]